MTPPATPRFVLLLLLELCDPRRHAAVADKQERVAMDPLAMLRFGLFATVLTMLLTR